MASHTDRGLGGGNTVEASMMSDNVTPTYRVTVFKGYWNSHSFQADINGWWTLQVDDKPVKILWAR